MVLAPLRRGFPFWPGGTESRRPELPCRGRRDPFRERHDPESPALPERRGFLDSQHGLCNDPPLDQFALGGLHMSNAPSVAPRQHSGTECLPPRNQPSWPELPHRPAAEDPKTLLPQADNPYTWPRFGGAFFVGSGTIRRAPDCFWAEASSANVSFSTHLSPPP